MRPAAATLTTCCGHPDNVLRAATALEQLSRFNLERSCVGLSLPGRFFLLSLSGILSDSDCIRVHFFGGADPIVSLPSVFLSDDL